MVYRIVYKKSVSRDLKRLPKAEAKRLLDQIESRLAKGPESEPILKGPFAGLGKYRIGDYRVIYALINNEIIILRIGHRRNVYKRDI